MSIKKDTLNVEGLEIGIYTEDFKNEYMSLTDMARYRNGDDPRFVIQNWMRNKDTIEFLAVWEMLHNPDFNRVQFEAVRAEAGTNRFVMTPTRWIETTASKGIICKSGRYGGGTYAHADIALEFASWLSPVFKLYVMKDYRRLKHDESSRLSLGWNLNREISKLNYRVHTDAIKANILPPDLTAEQKSFIYADEADLLNVALFGVTAREWRNANPGKKGNIRDYATIHQLLVLANLESFNAILINQGQSQADRLQSLRQVAVSQLNVLSTMNADNLPTIK